MSGMSKILIVDDDSSFVYQLSEVLVSYGQFEVLTATSRGEEIAALEKQAISIVVVDIDAGCIDGYAFLARMSTEFPHVQCVVMTRTEHREIRKISECLHRDSLFIYLYKPANLKRIGGAILEALHRQDENDFAQGISPCKVLYLFKAEKKTARLYVKFGIKKQGILDIDQGLLINAYCENMEGEEAALEILSWPPLGFILAELTGKNRVQNITPEELSAIQVKVQLQSEDVPPEHHNLFGGQGAGGRIKLFIIDDSRMMRKVIARIFEDDDTVEVIGEASNGEEALQIMPQLKPDVVTLDVQMPVMDGLTSLKHMMIQVPTPTVMLSAYTREGSVVTYDALKYGAVDFVAKPAKTGGLDLREQTREISKKVHLAAAVELEALKYIRAIPKDKGSEPLQLNCETLVAIGAAEGGYGALLKVIPHLSRKVAAAYFVILYARPEHVDSFVDYLDDYCPLRVQRAQHNGTVEGGVCYLASGSEYLTIHETDDALVQHLSAAPFASQRGSVNMLMFSIAEVRKAASLGIVLSGLGSDGAEGLAEILRVGGKGIIQDPTSSLYKEMPQCSRENCRTAQIINDIEIPAAISTLLTYD